MASSKYDHFSATNYLSNLCKDGTPLRGRIALLSFPNEISAKAIDTAIMLIEYTQLMSLFLRAATRFYAEQVIHSIEIYTVLLVFVKFLNPGNLLPLNQEGLGTVKRVLELCVSLYIVRVSLFFFIVWLALKRKTSPLFLVRSWQWVFYLQTKVFFNLFTSIYSNTYEAASKGLLGLDPNQRYFFMVTCLTMIALEFAFSVTLTTQFFNILPFKRFSASKNNALEINVLVQKFANNMLRRALGFSMNAAIWIYGPMNIIFSAVRIHLFFRTLPMYNYKALKLQLFLLIITFSLSVACFANVALDWKKINMNFVILTWILLTIICTKLSFGYLEKKLLKLVFEKGINTKRSPEFLVHKIIFIKRILTQNKVPTDACSKADIHHLLNSALTLDSFSSDLQCKMTRNKIFMRYLEDLRAQFPKNNFLKLYTAYRYAQKTRLYGLSTNTLAEIKHSKYPTIVASKSILKNFIQTRTQFDYQHGNYTLNLYDYCKGLANLSKLKLKMAEQAKLQWTLCDEIVSNDPDLAKTLCLGNKANYLKQKIHKNFQQINELMPDYHTKPYLLYAYYKLFMEYNLEDSSKYKQIYQKNLQRYQKQFENDRLLQENLFQDDTFLIVVSGEKETAGIINYISPNLVDLLGRNLTGSQASVTTPPFLRANTASLVKLITGPNALSIQNTMKFQFFYHLRGYMFPFNYYLNITPSNHGGLSFMFICRRYDQGKEFLLLNEEGEIESFTKEIGDILGLFSKDGLYLVETKTPIDRICPELAQANQAFNFVASPPAPGNQKIVVPRQLSKLEIPQIAKSHQPIASLEEAKEICEIYSEAGSGKNITLNPVHQCKDLIYRCTIRTLMVRSKVGKVVTLEKVHTPVERTPSRQSSEESNIEQDFKEDGKSEWINFERLKSEQQVLMTTPRNDNLSSARNLISPRIQTNLTSSNKTETKTTAKFDNYKPHWLLNNHSHNKSNQLYQQALEKPYSPFFYNLFTLSLYALFLTVFVMYLYMSISMHQGISDLQVSKQILRMAEARNNYLGILDGTTRLLWTYATQLSSLPDFFQGRFIPLPIALKINQQTVASLGTVNNDLFALTSSLNQEQRRSLFHKDIRMLDSSYETYLNTTSFQATDRIIDASLKSNDLVLTTNLKAAIPSLNFVLRNIMNDILIKNTEISQSFRDSLQDKKDYFASWVAICFGISLSFLIFIIVGFLCVLYLQSRSEKSNLFALTKLKPEAIHNLKRDFLVFQSLVLEDDDQLSSDKNVDSSKLNKLPYQQRQFPISKTLRPIYHFYFLKFGLLILVPIILFVANFVLFKKYLDQLASKASQIYFIDQMNSRFGVLSGSFLELTSQNDTTVIYNQQASVSLNDQISQISLMTQSISDVLGVEASSENDLIHDILYEDACLYLKNAFAHPLCHSLGNYQKKPNLISLLSNLESSMRFVYSKFINSNRTLETLLSLQAETYNEISLYAAVVIQEEIKLIAEVLNNDFEGIVSHSQSLNIILNALILVVIAFESLIIHFLVINRLKQKETQFKQILELFPAHIVLSNFILKPYLTKTSNQTFNSFRD